MRRRALLRLVFLAFLSALGTAPSRAIPATLPANATLTVSTAPAARALTVSDPVMGMGDGRLLFPFHDGSTLSQFGNAAANAGDINGDGDADLIVGAWSGGMPSDRADSPGSAFLYFGGGFGNEVPGLVFHGSVSGDGFGSSVASAGDVNGDGYGDLIIGARLAGFGRRGRAYLYLGGYFLSDRPFYVFSPPQIDAGFGASVASCGDVNGDGVSDVIVGAPGLDGDGQNRGHAYVYFGGRSTPSLTLAGSGVNDHFGSAVSSAGDFNGDGFPDFVVGEIVGGAGRAYLYYGGPALDAIPDQILGGEAAGDRFGAALAPVGDVNGDGYDDLMVSAPTSDAGGQDAGRAYLYFGGPGIHGPADLVLTGQHAGDNFGQSVASAGDMNTDGYLDFIVGAPQAAASGDLSGSSVGRAYVYFGGPDLDGTPDLVLIGDGGGDRFGASAASAGDLNGDGGADVVVGAPLNALAGSQAGRAYLLTTWSHPPAVTAPSTVVAGTRHFLQIPVSAVDAEGDPILSLTAEPLPPGATFRVGYRNQAGMLEWTPTDLQIGTYDVTFTASNLESRSATTRITVIFANSPPGLNPVDGMTLREGATADQLLSGFDLDGDPLSFQLIGAPPFAAVSAINGSSAMLHLAPDYGSAGSYLATVQIDDGHGATASAPLAIVVEHQNRGPVLSAPVSALGEEGSPIDIPIEAIDPDGDAVALGVLSQPLGSLFVDHGDNTGAFSWTPGYEQAGSYVVTFTARDNVGASGAPWDLTITVADMNRGPVASAGGPYAGVIEVPIVFDGTGSSDPDGSALTYRWDFGDLANGTGATVSHAYTSGGAFTVVLTVSDGGLSGQANTSATVQDVFAARAFVEQPNRTVRLVSAKATWCAEVEPVENSFLMNAVLTSAVVMRYGDRQISGIGDRVSIGADRDANGIAEMTICFAKTDLRTLFSGLPKGTSTVTVTLEGDLSTGGKFRAALPVDVTSSGGGLAASLSPNPLNPAGVLTFTTSRPGRVRVTLFDLRGRLVRTLLPAQDLGAGYHDVRLDGRNDRQESLSSGAYFYRIEAVDGVVAGRFVLLK